MLNRESHYDEVFDAQLHFRIILDAMAKPGIIKTIDGVKINPPQGIHHASSLIGFALLNADTCFSSVQLNQKEIAEYLLLNTGAPFVTEASADFIFMDGMQPAELIASIKFGTLEYPENSATIIIDVEEISDSMNEGSLSLILSGPGIENQHRVFIKGMGEQIISFRSEVNAEYPLGIDMILTDLNNRMICIPRTSKIVQE